MPNIYIVHELELDETRRGGRGEQEIKVKAPIRLKTTVVGCFIADNGSQACRFAAQAVERPGKFVATQVGKVRKIELGEADTQSPAELEKEVRKKRKRASKARCNDR